MLHLLSIRHEVASAYFKLILISRIPLYPPQLISRSTDLIYFTHQQCNLYFPTVMHQLSHRTMKLRIQVAQIDRALLRLLSANVGAAPAKI